MYNKVSVGLFALQIAKGIENPTDAVVSVATWSGLDVPAVFTVHVRRADGTEYEINIQADSKYSQEVSR